jgi:hypothetical protein
MQLRKSLGQCRSHGSVSFCQYLNFKSVLYFFAVPVNCITCTEVAIRTYLFAKARRDFMHKSGIHLSHAWMHTTCIYIRTIIRACMCIFTCIHTCACTYIRTHTYTHIRRLAAGCLYDVCVRTHVACTHVSICIICRMSVECRQLAQMWGC